MRTHTLEATRLEAAFQRGLVLAFALACLGLAACSDDETTKPTEDLAPPGTLSYVNGDQEVILAWQASPDAARDDFKGYIVYRATGPMGGFTEAQITAAALNPNTTALLSYTDATAQNGVQHYYSVRTILDNGDRSEASNEIHTAARVESDVQTPLAEFADDVNPSGLDLSDGSVHAMEFANKALIDVYLGTTATDDDPGQQLSLKSPSLVQSANDWSDRAAQLKLLGTGQAAWDTPTTDDTGWGTSVALGTTQQEIVGKVIAIKTPAAGGQVHYAKIQIIGFTEGDFRQIAITRAYQDLPNYPRFDRRRSG